MGDKFRTNSEVITRAWIPMHIAFFLFFFDRFWFLGHFFNLIERILGFHREIVVENLNLKFDFKIFTRKYTCRVNSSLHLRSLETLSLIHSIYLNVLEFLGILSNF